MAIDRILGSGIPSTPPAKPEKGGVGQAEFHIDVGKREATEVSATPAATSSPLERVRSGEIGVEEYVEAKVNAATAHLSALAPSDFEFVKQSLREKMMLDPDLQRLIEQASGVTVSSEDG